MNENIAKWIVSPIRITSQHSSLVTREHHLVINNDRGCIVSLMDEVVPTKLM